MNDPATKLARHRLNVLELAEALGNVTAACRQAKMDRTSFYEYKRRFQTHGLAGLKDLPPIHHSHPATTPPEVVDQILAVAGQYPTRGCVWISAQLKLRGVSVSSPTIQKILNKHELGSRFDRLLRLEAQALAEAVELTPAQVMAIEKANPCFRERHVESSRPGELLCQDTFYVGHLKGTGKVYLQAVVDTFGSYAFGYLHTGKLPEHAALILHNNVVPQYQEWGLSIGAILTDNGREYCGRESHPYELFLALHDIAHRKTQVRRPRTNGFVERFNRTVLDEFFRLAFRTTFYDSLAALQTDLDAWLHTYNTERPHLGYRNRGKRPIDTVNEYRQNVSEDA